MISGQGCTSIGDKLFGTEREEITPFAQKTVDVLAVESIQVHDSEWIHLRRYVEEEFLELDELQRDLDQVELYRDRLVEYSIELVRLTELYEKESDRVTAYASHLEQVVRVTELNRFGISETEWAEILADIRTQETFLDALRVFQRVINKASRDFGILITRVETESLVAMRKEFNRRIESHYREVNEFLLIQHGKRKELLAAMNAIDGYRSGETDAIVDFRQKNTSVSALFISNAPDKKQLAVLEDDLSERLQHSTTLIGQLDGDYANYVNARTELDLKEDEIRHALTIARLQIETWTRAHHALAHGVKEPGELMELTLDAARFF